MTAEERAEELADITRRGLLRFILSWSDALQPQLLLGLETPAGNVPEQVRSTGKPICRQAMCAYCISEGSKFGISVAIISA